MDVRLDAANGIVDLQSAINISVKIHASLWALGAAAAASPTTNTALVISAINDDIDMHEIRMTGALRSIIPASIWIALLAISSLSMFIIGTQVGPSGKRGLVFVIPLSLAFSALIVLVVDLDRPQRELITVSQQALVDLQNSMSPASAQ